MRSRARLRAFASQVWRHYSTKRGQTRGYLAWGVSQFWNGNSLVGKPCQRWLRSFTGFWRNAGGARGRGESAAVLSAEDWRDVVWPDTFDWAPVTNVDTRSTRHVVGGGALRGRSPRTREGRIGPTAQNCSGQWSVVSGQRRIARVHDHSGTGPLHDRGNILRAWRDWMRMHWCQPNAQRLTRSPSSKRYIWRPLPPWVESMTILAPSGLERGWRSQRRVSV